MKVLSQIRWRQVTGRRFGSGHVAHCPAAYFHGCRGIGLSKRRRESQRRRHIVKALAGIISWQESIYVNFQCQQIANGVFIFTAIKPVQSRCGWYYLNSAIKLFGDAMCKIVQALLVGSFFARWWHHTNAYFFDHFFPGLGFLVNMSKVQAFQIKTSSPVFKVVAFDAILIDEFRHVLRYCHLNFQWQNQQK